MPEGAPAQPWRGNIPLARGGTLAVRYPLVMGILNATPDSFSDGGQLATADDVGRAVRGMLAAGADILDVGGESTRPGHAPVAAGEEWRRVEPVLAAIRRVDADVPVSIDTRKAEVARLAIAAGASFINDVSGLGDAGMAAVAREAGCAIVLMRNRPLIGEPLSACARELAATQDAAQAAGIRREQIILDPGLGFGDPPGADAVANMVLLRGIAHYAGGRPVLIGASRKRFVGALSGTAVARDRVSGSVAAAVAAVEAGAAIVRVHDVAETVAALRGR